MEIPLSGNVKKQIKITGRLKKPYVMSTQKYDWQINKVNDDSFPKLKIVPIKLNKKIKRTTRKQESWNRGLQTKDPTDGHPSNVTAKLLRHDSVKLKPAIPSKQIDDASKPNPKRQIRLNPQLQTTLTTSKPANKIARLMVELE